MTAPQLVDGPGSLDAREQLGEGAGYTVWKHAGRIGRPWSLAWSGDDSYTARQVYERLASRSSWGAVRLLDPMGRDLAFHLGRGYGSR